VLRVHNTDTSFEKAAYLFLAIGEKLKAGEYGKG
jgi:hypothetical protein